MIKANTQFKYTIYSLTGCYPYPELDDARAALRTYGIEDMKEALKNGADIDVIVEKDKGYTAIFYAALYGRHDVLEELLKLGADPNIQDKNGMTALHLMVEMLDKTVGNTVEAIGILLKYGARPDIKDSWQTTAIELAKEKKDGLLGAMFELALEKLELQAQEKKLLKEQEKQNKQSKLRKYIRNNRKF